MASLHFVPSAMGFLMIMGGQDLGFTSHLEDNNVVPHLFFSPKGPTDELYMSEDATISKCKFLGRWVINAAFT